MTDQDITSPAEGAPAGPGPKARARRRERRALREELAREQARAMAGEAAAPGSAPVRRHHWGILLSFLLTVVAPSAVTAVYLWGVAEDQYASTTGFSVRKEELGSAVETLVGVTEFSGSSSSDTDILYEFIQSQELVAKIDAELDLRAIWSRPEFDPVFAFDPAGSIEDLLSHWQRMVKISYDSGTGLIEIRAQAFTAEEAQAIARTIFDESSRMINELSAIAREDATRYAREELATAVERLKGAREAVTAFRSRTQIVDPSADIQGQMGLLNTLNQQLAAALIELDILRETTRAGDPRIDQATRRIAVIENRIAEERRKFGIGGDGPGGEDYATLVAEFERLSVDREFAEQAYTAALSAFDSAQAEAQRQSRYLAAYVKPTLAETAEYPQRLTLLGLIGLFLLLGWSIAVLIYYSLRDRR